ncbi:hypothetical protein PUG42_27115 [Erwiniaceae bacterium L1_54_3]|nr:hypothetical protein [Erwiniaceae bacterium L1_54_3]
MSIQHDGKGHVIIGEAALSLALSEKEISVDSLINELGHMAGAGGSDNRIAEISEARSWLKSFHEPEHAVRHVPYLQTLVGLNYEKN